MAPPSHNTSDPKIQPRFEIDDKLNTINGDNVDVMRVAKNSDSKDEE